MFGWLSGMLKRLRRPTMGLVIGARTCRVVLSSAPAIVHAEPSVIVWKREGGQLGGWRVFGDVAMGVNVEWGRDAYHLAPFGTAEVDPLILTNVLRYFRHRAAERTGSRAPSRLLVTARPDLLAALGPVLQRCARRAGFRRASVVDEHVCLRAASSPLGPGLTLIVDLGARGTRVYCWPPTGARLQARVETDRAGDKLVGAVNDWVLAHEGLEIGRGHAERLLHSCITSRRGAR